jgi:hypothetical protein
MDSPAPQGVMKASSELAVLGMGGTIDKDYPRTTMGYAFEIDEPAATRVFSQLVLFEHRRLVIYRGPATGTHAHDTTAAAPCAHPSHSFDSQQLFLHPPNIQSSACNSTHSAPAGCTSACSPRAPRRQLVAHKRLKRGLTTPHLAHCADQDLPLPGHGCC